MSDNGPPLRGLTNDIEDNHCFLNVLLQTLFHCHHFTTTIVKNPAVKCLHRPPHPDACVLHAVRTLFREYVSPHTPNQKLTCENVRSVLAATKPMFSSGNMNDVVETLEDLLTGLHDCLGGEKKDVCPCKIHTLCGTTLETSWCCPCSSDETAIGQFQLFMHYIPMQAISSSTDSVDSLSLDNFLQTSAQLQSFKRPCDKCKTSTDCVVTPLPTLTQKFYFFRFVWSSESQSDRHFGELQKLFPNGLSSLPSLGVCGHVSSVVCLGRLHYVNYLFRMHSGAGEHAQTTWNICNDTSVWAVGSSWHELWESINHKNVMPYVMCFEIHDTKKTPDGTCETCERIKQINSTSKRKVVPVLPSDEGCVIDEDRTNDKEVTDLLDMFGATYDRATIARVYQVCRGNKHETVERLLNGNLSNQEPPAPRQQRNFLSPVTAAALSTPPASKQRQTTLTELVIPREPSSWVITKTPPKESMLLQKPFADCYVTLIGFGKKEVEQWKPIVERWGAEYFSPSTKTMKAFHRRIYVVHHREQCEDTLSTKVVALLRKVESNREVVWDAILDQLQNCHAKTQALPQLLSKYQIELPPQRPMNNANSVPRSINKRDRDAEKTEEL